MMPQVSNRFSFSKRILDLIEDHLDLAQLEWRYESETGRRRLGGLALAALSAFAALIMIHLMLIDLLHRWGMPLYGIGLLLAVLWSGVAWYAYQRFARRAPDVGTPFQATREELRNTLRWTRQNLS
jgi:uncharacterized membrane protein YqjE